MTPFPTPTPGGPVWRILFKGAPCSEMSVGCQPFDGTPSYLYVVNSDGTGLEQIETFPSSPLLPMLSPDGSRMAYSTGDGLYVANADGTNPVRILDSWAAFDFSPDGESIVYGVPHIVENNLDQRQTQIGRVHLDDFEQVVLAILPVKVSYMYVSPDGNRILAHSQSLNPITNHFYVVEIENGKVSDLFNSDCVVGPVRWLPNGQRIEFVTLQKEDEVYINVFYTIDRNGENLRPTLTIANLGNWIHWGDWSPNGQELAFSLPPYSEDESLAGLYILDLNSGYWQQILSAYDASLVRTWTD